MLKTNKKYKSFTLVEVIIVIAIISIFTMLSYKSWRDTRNNAEVEAVCSQIASLINQTRNDALTGKRVTSIDSLVNNEVPDGFRIYLYRKPLLEYRIAAVKTATEDHVLTNVGNISTKVTMTSSDVNFAYAVPNGNGSASQAFPVSIELSLGGINKKVEVSPYRAVCK